MGAGHQSAAILIIGNEVLSGRTRDANGWLAAQRLFTRGCRLAEIAVVPDEAEIIIVTLNRLRNAYDAVITSGGIGPTHDDITMDAVATAFGVGLTELGEIVELMQERYGEHGVNDGRRRMARIPEGASPIKCEKTIAPGANIGNVYVLAGVPSIFASQLEAILEAFGDGETPFLRSEIEVSMRESVYAEPLAGIQQQFPEIEVGSYPSVCGDNPTGKICLSGRDAAKLEEAETSVRSMLENLAAK